MLRIEHLQKHHIRNRFDCGESTLNDYLVQYARQNDERNIARTFVAVASDACVQGFYTISAADIEFSECPDKFTKHLPKYPLPAARIGQLAVDRSTQGHGLGARLLIDALQRIYTTSDEIGIKIILVDALNEKACAFYTHFGFVSLPGNEFRLFLPVETVTGIFQSG